MKRIALLTAALLAGGSLTACSMDPKLAETPLPVAQSWPVGDAYLRANEAALPTVTYRDIFRDPRLQAVIEQALANNQDLRVAAANIAAARAQYRIQRADRFPQLDAFGRATLSDSGSGSSSSSTTSSGSGAGTGTTTTTSTSSGTRTSLSAGLQIPAFELDLFGRIASLTRAEQNRYFASEATARATRLTLVGDIADAWLSYGADASLLKIAQNTAGLAENSVKLTRARLDGGIAPRTDLAQAQQVLETARAGVAEQTTALAQDVNAMQLLVGAAVDAAQLPVSIQDASAQIAELPAGVDSHVLLRRPDVVEAEYTLRAANAEIGAARAALFPSITLTGLLGFASDALRTLFAGGAFNWSAGGSATYSIFRAGAGKANVDLSRAQADAALANYEKAIQTAFRDVSDALARRGTMAEQLRATRANRDAAADTARLEEARYKGGIDTYLSSLDAQRSLYTSERTLVQAQLTAGSNLVSLYRALGGDALLEPARGGPVPQTQPEPASPIPPRP